MPLSARRALARSRRAAVTLTLLAGVAWGSLAAGGHRGPGFLVTGAAGPPQPASAPPVETRPGRPAADTLVQGIVRDEEGRPIAAVRVELREAEVPVASTFSNRDGAFRLRVPPGASPSTLVLHLERLGYRPRAQDMRAHMTTDSPVGELLIVVMEAAPLPLPGFRVEAAMESCPARSHEAAEALWDAMARRHPGGLDTLGAATYTLVRTDTLAAAGATPSEEERLVAGQRGFSGRLHLAWERRVDREGYAFPVRRTDPDGSYDAWSYAPMEADFASHFATPRFLQHHRLRAPSPSDDGGWILAFCPPDDTRPSLEGHLELTPDTLLLRAEWRFRTTEPREDAGGWTRFPGTTDTTPPLLLPLESVTWRTLRNGKVQRRAQWYEAWIVTPGDSVPFLPERAPDVDPSPLLR